MTLALNFALPSLTPPVSGSRVKRWGRSGYAVSFALHGVAAALALAWTFHHIEPAAPIDKPIELVIEKTQPEPPKPKEIVPPKPQPLQPPLPAPAPKTVAAPRPAPAPAPAPTVAPPVNAEPVAETPPPPPAPAPVAAPAPAPAPVAKASASDGIPTDYVNKVFARINRIAAGHYPKAAQLRGQEGRVVYHLVLSPAGELLSYELEPSGVESLDKAAEEALKAAAPFPKLPDLGASSYKLTGAIAYKLGA